MPRIWFAFLVVCVSSWICWTRTLPDTDDGWLFPRSGWYPAVAFHSRQCFWRLIFICSVYVVWDQIDEFFYIVYTLQPHTSQLPTQPHYNTQKRNLNQKKGKDNWNKTNLNLVSYWIQSSVMSQCFDYNLLLLLFTNINASVSLANLYAMHAYIIVH